MKKLLALLLLGAPMMGSVAQAADDIDDLDSSGSGGTKKKAKKDVRAQLEGEIIREIERGLYLKAGMGSGAYLLRFGGTPTLLRPGTALALSIGSDFVDNERSSLAWEVTFHQGVYNGMTWEQQASMGVPPGRLIQGDTRTYAALGIVEYSAYPTRRLGIGVRGGAGIMFAPLLIHREAWETEVRNEFGGALPSVHNTPHPVFQGGPTIEYYTKLSHFSIGADVDVSYAIQWDLGVSGVGYLKYTF